MEYECNQVPVILHVPDNTVKLTLIAKLLDKDDNFIEVQNVFEVADVVKARINGDEWEAENVHYVLTDKGRESLHGRNQENTGQA